MLVAACEKQKVVDLGFIHRFVPSSDKNPRTFLLLHGTGGNESDLLPLGRALDPKAALLSPRGKILENGAPRFFRRFAEGVFDEEDVVRRANELADFVLVAADEYKIDRADLTAVGYSNGANIAASLLLLRPEVLQSAILFRAMVALSSPPKANLRGKRILLCNGESDPIIPKENGERLARIFREAGASVSAEFFPAGHALTEADLTTATSWLESG